MKVTIVELGMSVAIYKGDKLVMNQCYIGLIDLANLLVGNTLLEAEEIDCFDLMLDTGEAPSTLTELFKMIGEE